MRYSNEETLASTRLKFTSAIIDKYTKLYDTGVLQSPLEVLHEKMYNSEKDQDCISAAKEILRYFMLKPPMQKQIQLQHEEDYTGDKQDRLRDLLLQTNVLSILDTEMNIDSKEDKE